MSYGRKGPTIPGILRRPLSSLGLAAAVLGCAGTASAQGIERPGVVLTERPPPTCDCVVGPVTPLKGAGGPDRTRPAWVVGDVPDTVWVLVEASVETGDEDRAKQILREAEGLAREAIRGHETNIGRRFALAAVLGMRTDVEGGRTKVGVASELYRELRVVLELAPEHTRARYMMGRLHAGVRRMSRMTRWLATNLLGGHILEEASWDEAEVHLVFAEAHAPEVPDHHLQLARLYMDTRRPELAAVEAMHVLDLEATSPLEVVARTEALELADQLGIER